MAVMKTPGVYVVEKNAFLNSIVEVATAIPAFIGYTEKAEANNISLLNKPKKITSMAEYIIFFGSAPVPRFEITQNINPESNKITVSNEDYYIYRKDKFTFYYNMLLFFSNGGGSCYIVSVGNYSEKIEKEKLLNAIKTLEKEQEPTMLVIPELVNLENAADCYSVQKEMLNHCGNVTQKRFAILDIFDGYKNIKEGIINDFREGIGNNFLGYGAAYYPWLNTTILSKDDITFENISNFDDFLGLVHESLKNEQPSDHLKEEMARILNRLPASAAIAGIYTKVDNTKGVWKAPANVNISNVESPTISISHEEQEDLNVPVNGKAINAIRFFTGEGTKVWGVRTLDANSLDWKYIHIRRTMIMLEESIKNAAKAYVFEPNDANTWVNMKSMINNFLNGIWKRGGLAGASPDDAYNVLVGLGETMTPEDILEGNLRVTVLVAITRPAEFIEFTFQQRVLK